MNQNSRLNCYGKWLIQLREGVPDSREPFNKYLIEAVGMRKWLYTFPELRAGFSTMFEDMSRPLVLDVGCYWGNTVVEMAVHNPGINVLGLDLKYKRVVKSCRKIKREKVSNAKIAVCSIQELMTLLPGHSVSGILIFFPDPWEKKRHEKNRYLNESFFREITTKLTGQGFIWLKTDHKDYFDCSTVVAQSCGFMPAGDFPVHTIVEREYRTQFEETFIRQEKPVYQEIYVKKK
ncbi:MAG: tRNA (guanosine(46)-N7)-methyltransferase TrmB [bacterium]|nr:tRNA (guanosine(46)-N7)-methyltransferase TrmB [bacterium]